MKINKNLITNANVVRCKRTNSDIKFIVVHYVGALGDAKNNTDYYKGSLVQASADFWVGFSGDIWQGTDYRNYYSQAIGGGLQGSGPHPYYGIARNPNQVSVEMCVRKRSTRTMNATDKDWYFEDATVESAAELVAYLMKDCDVDIDHVIRHYDVNAKVCPNPFVYDTGKTSWAGFKKKVLSYYNGSTTIQKVVQYRIAKAYKDGKYVDQRAAFYESKLSAIKKECPAGYSVFDKNGNTVYTNTQTNVDKIWLGWTPRESGSKGFRCVNGDAGKAQGKYQFDYRYALVPFMKFCKEKYPKKFEGFSTYIAYGVGSSKLVSNASLASLWTKYCDKYPKIFERLQDTYAYQYYYLEVKKYLKNLYKIDLDDHSPAVKGSAFSMAIRSGALTGAKKFCDSNNKTDDATMMKLAYAKYGTNDASRWTRKGQLGDALSAYKNNTYTLVSKDGSAVSSTTSNTNTTTKTDNKKTETKMQYAVGDTVLCSSYYKKSTDDVKDAIIKNLSGQITKINSGKRNPYCINGTYWVNDGDIRSKFATYAVRVNTDVLNIRTKPTTSSTSKGYTGQGVFHIIEEAFDENGKKWGLLKSYQENRDGWIALYINEVSKA